MSKYHDGKYYYKSSEQLLSTIVVKFHEIKHNYEELTKRYDEVERAHQDLLHYIEFSNLNVLQGYTISKKLKHIRIERRLLKEEMSEAKIAYDVIDNFVVEQLIKQLSEAQSDCKKAEIKFDKSYTPRNLELTGISAEEFENVQRKYNDKLKNEIVVKK